MKKLFCILGKSGSGKDSICKEIEKLGYKVLKSYTTRPRRLNEGDTHIFIDENDLYKYKDDIIAYTKIGAFHYFSTKQQLYDSDVYIIDPRGLNMLKEIKDLKIISIYINVDDEERYKRAINRGDSVEVIEKRFSAEKEQFDEFLTNKKYDYLVLNGDFDYACRRIKQILENENQ
jgi:guanylate kinase